MKHLSLICLPLVVGLASCSERTVRSITYNFYTQEEKFYKDSGEINAKDAMFIEGKPVKIYVEGFNPLIYTVTGELKPGALFYTTDQPKILGDMIAKVSTKTRSSSPSAETINQAEDVELCIKLKELGNLGIGILTRHDQYADYYNSLIELNQTLDRLSLMRTIDSDCLCKNVRTISDAITSTLPSEISKSQDFIGCNASILCNGLVPSTELTRSKNYFYARIDTNIKQLARLEEEIAALIKSPDTTCSLYNNYKDDAFRKYIKELTTLLQKDKDEYLGQRNKEMTDIIARYSKIQLLEMKPLVGTFTPKQTDEFKVDLTFVNAAVNPNQPVVRTIEHDVSKPLKIDFSAGMFVTGLTDEVADKKVRVDGSTNYYRFDIHKQSDISYGAMGFTNFYSRFNPAFSLGLSLGAGIRLDNDAKVIFAGTGSVFLGKYQRVVLHFGAAVGPVTKMHSIYGAQEFLDANYAAEVKSVYEWSTLAGLSWNMTR